MTSENIWLWIQVSLLLKDSFVDSFPNKDRPFIKVLYFALFYILLFLRLYFELFRTIFWQTALSLFLLLSSRDHVFLHLIESNFIIYKYLLIKKYF